MYATGGFDNGYIYIYTTTILHESFVTSKDGSRGNEYVMCMYNQSGVCT